MNFTQSVYNVYEHEESVMPKLTLDRPSPCYIVIHAKLEDGTAKGELHSYVMCMHIIINTLYIYLLIKCFL